jgi:hypothetical protein
LWADQVNSLAKSWKDVGNAVAIQGQLPAGQSSGAFERPETIDTFITDVFPVNSL